MVRSQLSRSESDVAGNGDGMGGGVAGKRALTDDLAVQRRAAPPILAHGNAPGGEAPLSADESFESTLTGPMKPKPAVDDDPADHTQPAQGVRAATDVNIAFFFTGNDAFGQAARAYVEAYYPDHLRIEAKSFEHMFDQIDSTVENAMAGSHNERGHVEHLVMVTHANARGGMKIPLTEEKGSKKFTPWDVAKLQQETVDNPKLHGGFMAKRDRAMSAIDDHTRIEVRGCEIGQSPEAMEALRVMFGGEATVMAPTAFQGFQIETVGKGRLASWEQAHDMLVANLYIGADDLGELTTDELARVASGGEPAILRARKEKYVRTRFPKGIPTEFFVVGEANDKAFKAMNGREKVSKESEDVKYRLEDEATRDENGKLVLPDNVVPPYAITESDAQERDGRPTHWAIAHGQQADLGDEEKLSRAEAVARAEALVAAGLSGHGAEFLRLYKVWQLGGKENTVDTKVVVEKTPSVFNDQNQRRAMNDAYDNPDRNKDAWRATDLEFAEPSDKRGVEQYGSEHINEQDPVVAAELAGESEANGVQRIGDDKLILWGFGSNRAQVVAGHADALDELARMMGEHDLLTIDGHTDSVGALDANQRLSKQRAEEVAGSLRKRGVSKDHIATAGKGPSVPLESEDIKDRARARDARARNRRVEILRTPGWLRPGG